MKCFLSFFLSTAIFKCQGLKIHDSSSEDVQVNHFDQKTQDESYYRNIVQDFEAIISNHIEANLELRPGKPEKSPVDELALFLWDEFQAQAKDIIDEYGTQENTACVERIKPLLMEVLPKVMYSRCWLDLIFQNHHVWTKIGFWRIALMQYKEYNIQIHAFNQIVQVDGLHNHKWHFQSSILYGELRCQDYDVCAPVPHEYLTEDEKYVARGFFHREKFETETKPYEEYTLLSPKVYLKRIHEYQYCCGNSYYFPATAIHRIMPNDTPTATLVVTRSAPVRRFCFNKLEEHRNDRLGLVHRLEKPITRDEIDPLLSWVLQQNISAVEKHQIISAAAGQPTPAVF